MHRRTHRRLRSLLPRAGRPLSLAPATLTIATLTLAATLLAPPSPVAAQATPLTGGSATTSLTLAARPWLDGWYDEGQWVALDVAVANGGAALDAEVQATSGGAAIDVVPVALPTGADKHVPLLVRPVGEDVQVVLAGPAAALKGRQPSPVRVRLRRTRDEWLVAVVGDGRPLTGLEGLTASAGRSPVVQVGERVEDLPESSLGMASVDTVVLLDADLSRANDAQREALRQWVGLGGNMIIAGTPALPAVLDALPEGMRPAVASGSVSVPALGESLAAGILDAPWEGGGPVARLLPAPDAVERANAGDVPTIVTRKSGAGAVSVLAFDPSEPPVSQWGQLDKLWDMLAPDERGVWAEPVPDMDLLLAGGSVERESERLPSLGWALLLLVGYVLLVGPINYLVLRRRRRLDLAWVTIPSITLMATLVTYGVGVSLHGRSLLSRQLSIARVVPEAGVARVTTLVILFSPSSREYDVSLPGAYAYPVDGGNYYGGSPIGSGPLRAVQGPGAGVYGLEAAQWSMAGFAADAVIPWPVANGGDAATSAANMSGTLRNTLGQPLEGAQVIARGKVKWLGDLSAGQEVDLASTGIERDGVMVEGPEHPGTAEESSLFAAAFAGQAAENDYLQYLENSSGQAQMAVPPGPDLVLFGFSDKAPVPAEVKGFGAIETVRTLLFGRWPIPVPDLVVGSLPKEVPAPTAPNRGEPFPPSYGGISFTVLPILMNRGNPTAGYP